MSNKEVAEADEIVRRIRGKPTESELIQIQEDLIGEDEDEEDEGYRPLVHTLDDHHHSYIFTPKGGGIFPGENTYTPMLERKKRR